MIVNWNFLLCCARFRPRSRDGLLVMNLWLHNEKIVPLFCYNVPVSAVLYKLNRPVFIANRFSFKITGVRPYLDLKCVAHGAWNSSGRKKRTGAREGETWGEREPPPRVSLSRAPVFSCAHYFQAPACRGSLTVSGNGVIFLPTLKNKWIDVKAPQDSTKTSRLHFMTLRG